MGRLQDKVVLLTGAARGLGAAQAQTLAKEGARVVFGDLADDDGKAVEAQIRQAGGEAHYIHFDVSQEKDWIEAVRVTVERYGRIDVLVNNAGIVIKRVPIDERTVEEWDKVMAVNLR